MPVKYGRTIWLSSCRLCWIVMLLLWAPSPLRASCTVAAASANLGSVSSLTFAAQAQESVGSSGLACSALLSVASTNYVKMKVESSTLLLTGGPANQTVPFVVSATAGGAGIPVGSEYDFSSFTLLSLFSGPGNGLQLYYRAAATGALRAGTYSGTVTLRWYYSVCDIGALGVCVTYAQSPGLVRSPFNWGTGTTAVVAVNLIITNDCAITAPDLSFGTAPFVASFNAVTQTISIRCSAGTAYTVGLNNSANYLSPWRRMRLGATANYLNYEIYQTPASSTRWGSLIAGERRSSASAQTNAGTYDGTTLQGFTYRAMIDPSQATPVAGTYTDTVVIDVAF